MTSIAEMMAAEDEAFRARKAKRIGRAPTPILEEALSILDACVY